MIYVILYYIVSTLVCFIAGGGGAHWGVFNMVSILIPMPYIMYQLSNKYSLQGREYAWLELAIIMTIVRCIYTTACAYAPNEWIYQCNKIYFTFFAVWIIAKIIRRRGI